MDMSSSNLECETTYRVHTAVHGGEPARNALGRSLRNTA
jgi:hypothetical protein